MMDENKLDELIESCSYIDVNLKERCKKYFKQVNRELDDWFYSKNSSEDLYQGDIINNLEMAFLEVSNNIIEYKLIENQQCILLSNTCDMSPENKTREKFVSVAPVFSYSDFSQNKIERYDVNAWNNFLQDVKRNNITDILYIPQNRNFESSVVLLDRIFSIDINSFYFIFNTRCKNKILSLSQLGHYIFLIKLTNHFARYEDKSEIR
ncbi:MAG: hypothetical protein V1816_10200, partial [Pseudomonadota bacterium]